MDIPFTTQQFFEIIEKYNRAIFPGQVVILLLGILSIVILHSNIKSKNKIIGGFLGFLWLWIGVAYHLIFFTEINKAAFLFGGLFVIQGIIFLIETFLRNKLLFEFKGRSMDYIGYFFLFFGIGVYPMLVWYPEGSLERIITLGLPCPSTIFTFGFLLLTTPGLSKYVLIIPALWTIIGTTAAFNFGIYPDYFMAISTIIAVLYLLFRKKE